MKSIEIASGGPVMAEIEIARDGKVAGQCRILKVTHTRGAHAGLGEPIVEPRSRAVAEIGADSLMNRAEHLKQHEETNTSGPARGEPCCTAATSTPMAQKHDHHLCNSKGQKFAEIFFDQRETEIDSGGHSRGSKATAIADIDGIGINVNTWVVFRKFARPIPMSGCVPSVEKAGLCQDKCARTD
jgi:hypothetical protein